MASYAESSFSFIADFCNEVTCLSGKFSLCQKNHEVINRGGTNNDIVGDEIQVEDEKQPEEESEWDVNIFEFDTNSIGDSNIQFIDVNPNPSVLDDLIFDENLHEEEIITISDDESGDEASIEQIAKSKKICETLEQISVITVFSINDRSLSDLNIEDCHFDSVQEYLSNLPSINTNIGNCYGLDVRKKDLLCLESNSWLNDTIINLCFLLIQEKCLANNIELDVVSSHWYSQFLVSDN